MTKKRTRRGGFTLIEVLVTISIIALLMAITSAAYFRVLASETQRASESTLSKLNTALDQRWKAILDNAAQDVKQNKVPQSIITYAGGDPDRTRVVWTYIKLKAEFPTTYAEATTPIKFPTGAPTFNANSAAYDLPPRPVFQQQVQNAGTAEEQSAACAYVALTQTGDRGVLAGGDGLQQQVGQASAGSVFLDAWGRPILFARMASSSELNAAPYTRATSNLDPIDPVGKLTGWSNLTEFWTAIRANHVGNSAAVPLAPATYSASNNLMPVFISAGARPATDGVSPAWGQYFGGNDDGDDNLVSFRLRKFGQRGN